MISALAVPTDRVFPKVGYNERRSRLGDNNARIGSEEDPSEYFICGTINSLLLAVGCLFIGIVTLIVGMVQLTPGAEARQNSSTLILIGCGLISLGVIVTLGRLYCIKRQLSRYESQLNITTIELLLAQHRQFSMLTPDDLEELARQPTSTLRSKICEHHPCHTI